MAKTITHFMWGYQPNYRISQKVSADYIFRLLDDRLEPEVFLVGILSPQASCGGFPACVEPEDDYWVQSEDFDQALEIAATLRSAYPESRMFQSHPLAQQSQDDYLLRRSIRDAVHAILVQHKSRVPDIEYFVSIPERVGQYLVSVVIGLQRNILLSYYRLNRDSVPIRECREMPVTRSLLDAAVAEFLDAAAEDLRKPNPGLSDTRREAEEIVRAAGRRLTRDVAYRADQNSFGWHDLFRACNTVSSLKYEQGAGVGRLVIARESHEAVRACIMFAADLKLANFRGARKLLQLASHGSGLHSDGVKVFGLADVEGYAVESEDLFEVQFIDHHHWALLHANHVLMRVRYGQPYLVKPSTYEGKLPKDLPRIFKNISALEIDLLVSLVRQAERELHGTLLVITPAAEREAERLRGQSILINPERLTPAILAHLVSIDGAVMIDSAGYCYAIGVILDGIAKDEGDSTRGARYNSAVRYVSYLSSLGVPCLAVVISEDGGVDLVPNLPPAIARSKIEEVVNELAAIAKQDAVSWRRYNDLLGWLSKRQFYLLEEDCASINRSVAVIEARADQEEPMRIKLVRVPFAANPEMNAELYYEERLEGIGAKV
jgi:DNA integrity scanning protein DisA with diadenylate cyclase activity